MSSQRTSAAPRKPSRRWTRAVTLYPNDVPARAGRGVLLARLGRREAAHADAAENLEELDPMTVYQVAGIYALTSRQVPDDRREAFRLLGSALSQGFGLDLIPKDRDLESIRDQPELRTLVEAAVPPRRWKSRTGKTTVRWRAASTGREGWRTLPHESRGLPGAFHGSFRGGSDSGNRLLS